MTDDGFDEYDLFEAEYADQFDVLDELEGISEAKPQVHDVTSINNENDFLPNISQKESRRRKLFPSSKDENQKDSFVSDVDDSNDLIIDESSFESFSPEKKRPKLQKNFSNLPTTLDDDKDVVKERIDCLRYEKNLSTPQILQKIVNYRQNRNAKDFLEEHDTHATTFQRSSIQLTKVLIRPPMNSNFIAATSSDGQRVYMRMRSDDYKKKIPSINELITGSKSGSLLRHSMTELRQVIFEEKQFSVIEESRRITDEVRKGVLSFPGSNLADMSLDQSIEDTRDEGIYSEDDSQQGLWVNKYAPTRYTHLLSDESVNRSLLKWLKLWDCVVFGRDPVTKKTRVSSEKQANRKFSNKKTATNDSSLDDELDDTNRPRFKAALLCGPPGLGKTTLAHVIARHAGYHVVEMNASDDRSADVFRKKLEETTQMKSVLEADPRPNCLIIDEIDGAPQAAINVLLSAMSCSRKSDAKRKRGKTGANNILLRPIICICNDLYVPALRQLRQQSFVLQFPPTTSDKLASRLRQMCRIQHLDCDMTCLLALCEKSSNDIRTCINTLQFLQSKGKNKINIDSVRNLPIGQKDQHRSMFYVWSEIFQQPKNKRHKERNSLILQQSFNDGQKVSQFSARFYHILNLVLANGEYEKTLKGVFDNFLLMKFKDCAMQAVNKAYEWLILYDFLNVDILSRQEWSLMKYIPYLFVTFHLLFSCISPPRIQFPHAAQENRQKLQKSENLLSSMFSEMSPAIRCFTGQAVALLDIVPHLLTIMTPNLRPVNMQLYSANEKKQLQDLVSSMLSYNLTFRQERNDEGQYNYVLEPNMAAVCRFNDETNSARRQLSYAAKQIIAKEVEIERMRRVERVMTEKASLQQKDSNQVESEKKSSSEKKVIPNYLRRLENTMNLIPVSHDKPVVDFFSRFTKVKRVENKEGSSSKKSVKVRDPGIGNSDLWFKHNEGFSNAVRRKVYVKDFL